MTHHRITFRTEALEQLEEIYDYIAAAGSPGNAAGFTESIISFREGLADFPYRGMARDDLRPGLRTIGYKKSTMIAYATSYRAFRRVSPGNLDRPYDAFAGS